MSFSRRVRYFEPPSDSMSSVYSDTRPFPDTGSGRKFVRVVWGDCMSARDLSMPAEAKDLDAYRSKCCNKYFEVLHLDPMCNEVGLCDQLQYRINELGRRIGLDDKTLTADMNRIRYNCAKDLVWTAVRFCVKRLWEFQRHLIQESHTLDEIGAAALAEADEQLRARAFVEDPDCVEFVPDSQPIPNGKAEQKTTWLKARQVQAKAPQAKEDGAGTADRPGTVRTSPYSRIARALATAARTKRAAPITFDDDEDFVVITPAKRRALERRILDSGGFPDGTHIEPCDLTQGIPDSD